MQRMQVLNGHAKGSGGMTQLACYCKEGRLGTGGPPSDRCTARCPVDRLTQRTLLLLAAALALIICSFW